MSDQILPQELRSSFARLYLHIYVDCEPHQKVPAMKYAKLWQNISDRPGEDREISVFVGADRKQIKEFVSKYLMQILKEGSVFGSPQQNELTLTVVLLCRSLVYFGFYDFQSLLSLAHLLISLLDNGNLLNQRTSGGDLKTDRASSSTPASKSTDSKAVQLTKLYILDIFDFVFSVRLDFRVNQELVAFKKGFASKIPLSGSPPASPRASRSSFFRKSSTLALSPLSKPVKVELEKDEIREASTLSVYWGHAHDASLGLVRPILFSHDIVSPDLTPPPLFLFPFFFSFHQFHSLFGKKPSPAPEEKEELPEVPINDSLEFDLNNGREFVRILLEIIIIDNSQLGSKAVKLLFRHFSKAEELVESYRQVQLLISVLDVDNYRNIREAIDVIRGIIESREQKRKVADNALKKKPSLTGTQDDVHSPILDSRRFSHKRERSLSFNNLDDQSADLASLLGDNTVNFSRLLAFMKKLNRAIRSAQRVNRESQRLCRNLGAHTQILALLKFLGGKEEEDPLWGDVYSLAHTFLQDFCEGSPANQAVLFQELDFFIAEAEKRYTQPELKITAPATVTIQKIFAGNRDLCSSVPEKLINHLVNSIGTGGPKILNLQVLKSLAQVDGEPIRETQERILSALSTAETNILVFYNDDVSFKTLVQLMEASENRPVHESTDDLSLEDKDLLYHVTLIQLLASCAEGDNTDTAVKCQSLLLLEDIARVLGHPSAILTVKAAYVNFLSHVYAHSEMEIREVASNPILFTIFEKFAADFEGYEDPQKLNQSPNKVEYLAQNVACCLTTLFTRSNPIRIPSSTSPQYKMVCPPSAITSP